MSEYHFIGYSDYEIINNSIIPFNLSLQLYHSMRNPKSDEISTELNIIYTVFEILVAVIAIIGNLMVIIVFQSEKKLQRRTNYYIVSLAIADFLVGLFGVPFAILASIGLPTNLHACLFTTSMLIVLCTISIFCLVAVSVDRYWAILYPMAYSRNVNTQTAVRIIAMCWVAGMIVGFLPLFGWHAGVSENQPCLFVQIMDYNYLVFLYFATIITPALLLLASYAHIYRVIVKQVGQVITVDTIGDHSCRSSTSHIHETPLHNSRNVTMLRVLGAARKREVKATQNLSIIVLFFMICWIPLYTINCIKAFCPTCYVHPKLTFFCIILSHFNSAANPLLYAYHLKDFRLALKNLILKIFGIDVELPKDTNYRLSLASQQRLQSLLDKRSSLKSRVYIDSPVWLREQQKQAMKLSTVSSSLKAAHTMVAAVVTPNKEINKEIWKIVESSSEPEEYSKTKINISLENMTTKTKSTSKEGVNTSLYENRAFLRSLDDLDDNVFMNSPKTTPYNQKEKTLAILLREKLNSDSGSLDENNQIKNHILLSKNISSSNSYYPRKWSTSSEEFIDNETYQNSIFTFQTNKNTLSPDNYLKIKSNSPFFYRSKIIRSKSCNNRCGLSSGHDKLIPFKIVNSLLFPLTKHGSLFNIYDKYVQDDFKANRKRTSLGS